MISNYDQAENTASTGGMTAPAAPPMPPAQTPEDTPNLTDPTMYPDEPITAGLPMGAGPGPARDTRQQDTAQLKRYLPLIELYVDRPDTPNSVRSLFRYIRGS